MAAVRNPCAVGQSLWTSRHLVVDGPNPEPKAAQRADLPSCCKLKFVRRTMVATTTIMPSAATAGSRRRTRFPSACLPNRLPPAARAGCTGQAGRPVCWHAAMALSAPVQPPRRRLDDSVSHKSLKRRNAAHTFLHDRREKFVGCDADGRSRGQPFARGRRQCRCASCLRPLEVNARPRRDVIEVASGRSRTFPQDARRNSISTALRTRG